MVRDGLDVEGRWPDWQREIIYDPQTSGGLLAAVDPAQADDLLEALHAAGVRDARQIGQVEAADGAGRLRLV
jgi:selenide,water dikinase